jgi:hypothetical protein
LSVSHGSLVAHSCLTAVVIRRFVDPNFQPQLS